MCSEREYIKLAEPEYTAHRHWDNVNNMMFNKVTFVRLY